MECIHQVLLPFCEQFNGFLFICSCLTDWLAPHNTCHRRLTMSDLDNLLAVNFRCPSLTIENGSCSSQFSEQIVANNHQTRVQLLPLFECRYRIDTRANSKYNWRLSDALACLICSTPKSICLLHHHVTPATPGDRYTL